MKNIYKLENSYYTKYFSSLKAAKIYASGKDKEKLKWDDSRFIMFSYITSFSDQGNFCHIIYKLKIES